MRTTLAAASVLALALASAGAAAAQSEARVSALKARGVFVEHDAAAATVSVRERGRLRVYALLDGAEGAQTEVSIESVSARVSDLEEGAPVIVTWHPDADDADLRIATRIEAPRIPKSFREDLR